MDDILENIGKRIAESRRSAGFTQEELAKRVVISRQAINAIENDRMSPNLIHAFKITKSLNQKYVEDVFTYEE